MILLIQIAQTFNVIQPSHLIFNQLSCEILPTNKYNAVNLILVLHCYNCVCQPVSTYTEDSPWFSRNLEAFSKKLSYAVSTPTSKFFSSTISTIMATSRKTKNETMQVERSPMDSSLVKYCFVRDKRILLILESRNKIKMYCFHLINVIKVSVFNAKITLFNEVHVKVYTVITKKCFCILSVCYD